MSLEGQRLQPDRYSVVPRTLSFLLRGEQILLLKLPAGRGAWAGMLNGVGGHVEQGEEPRASALREVVEETGLAPGPSFRLTGVVLIDTQQTPGIALYVFVGEAPPAIPVQVPKAHRFGFRCTPLATRIWLKTSPPFCRWPSAPSAARRRSQPPIVTIRAAH